MPGRVKRHLAGKRIVITGSSSGIGRQLAIQLAQKGCRLILNARREDRLAELVAELNAYDHSAGKSVGREESQFAQTDERYLMVVGDVCQPGTRLAILETAQQKMGGLDVLINNAGVGAVGPFAQASEQRMRQVMEVNFFAPAELIRMTIPVLENGDQPAIVNIGSVLGHRAVPQKSEYCASKFALHGLTDSLRSELEPMIDVIMVSPSTTNTEFFENVIDKSSDKYGQMSNPQSPEYVARRTIRAIELGSHEVILSWSGWGLVLLDRWMPRFAHRIVRRFR